MHADVAGKLEASITTEDGGSTVLRNVVTVVPDCMTSHHSRRSYLQAHAQVISFNVQLYGNAPALARAVRKQTAASRSFGC